MITAVRFASVTFAAGLLFGLGACVDESVDTPPQQQEAPLGYMSTQPVDEIAVAMKTVVHLAKGNWELAAAEFDTEKPVKVPALEKLWSDLENKHGEYVKIADSQGQRTEQGGVITLTLEFEADAVDLVFEVEDDKITSLTAPSAQ